MTNIFVCPCRVRPRDSCRRRRPAGAAGAGGVPPEARMAWRRRSAPAGPTHAWAPVRARARRACGAPELGPRAQGGGGGPRKRAPGARAQPPRVRTCGLLPSMRGASAACSHAWLRPAWEPSRAGQARRRAAVRARALARARWRARVNSPAWRRCPPSRGRRAPQCYGKGGAMRQALAVGQAQPAPRVRTNAPAAAAFRASMGKRKWAALRSRRFPPPHPLRCAACTLPQEDCPHIRQACPPPVWPF